MFTSTFLLLGSLLFGGEKVVINEFSYDDSGTDDKEYVELYNPTRAAIDISGWQLVSKDSLGTNSTFTVPANTMLAAGGFYVFGSALVPNVNQIVGTTNIWENDSETLELVDAGGNVIDSLRYEANKANWAGAESEGEGVWGNFTMIDNVETSWSRVRDGWDTNNNRDFRLAPWTPGKSNNLPATAYSDNFDSLTVGDPLADFGSSFAAGRVIDPTVADTNNPGAIAASPQGGKAAIFWDRAGGGNSNMLLRDGVGDVVIEAYVYFDAALEPTGELETWSIGAQGTTGTFYNLPDPSGSLGFTANGNTGVSWTYEVTSTAATLYLVDHNDGGSGAGAKSSATVIGSVKIVPTTNDGWQRLRLEISGNTVTGYFGGTYGGTNGTKITGTIAAPAVGGVYIGYREGLATNSTARPFTCDQLAVTSTATNESFDTSLLTAKGSTVSTPRVSCNSPRLGNSSFALNGVGLVPNGGSFLVIGLIRNTINLGTIGGQPDSFIYVDPGLVFGLTANATGDASFPLPIPNNTAFRGAIVDVQILDVDPALTVGIKLANSRPVKIRVD